jgi:hypothetical protein
MSVVAQHSLPAALVLAITNTTDLYKQPRRQSLHAYLVIHGAGARSTCPDAALANRQIRAIGSASTKVTSLPITRTPVSRDRQDTQRHIK